MTLAYTAKTDAWKLDIIHDDDGGYANPRDNDNASTMIMWETRYSSPDPADWSSFASFYTDWMPKLENLCPECGNDGTTAFKERYYAAMHWTPDRTSYMDAEELTTGDDGYRVCSWCGHAWEPGPGEGAGGVCLLLSRGGYDGSIHTAGTIEAWEAGDHEPEGVIFVTAETIAKEWGSFTSEPEVLIDGKMVPMYQGMPMLEWVANVYLEGDVTEYSTWAVGNVYGYRLFELQKVHVLVTLREGSKDTLEDEDEDRWEEVDACWGFITENPETDIPEWQSLKTTMGDEEYASLMADMHYV